MVHGGETEVSPATQRPRQTTLEGKRSGYMLRALPRPQDSAVPCGQRSSGPYGRKRQPDPSLELRCRTPFSDHSPDRRGLRMGIVGNLQAQPLESDAEGGRGPQPVHTCRAQVVSPTSGHACLHQTPQIKVYFMVGAAPFPALSLQVPCFQPSGYKSELSKTTSFGSINFIVHPLDALYHWDFCGGFLM